ncbi:MAG: TetR/AcrR family transcriptional regulator [Rhodospirillales bacterium]|jgi:AcrR family transcriptional regulator
MADPARRSSVKHAAILGAAVALAGEIGYAAVTIEAIAARAGVGKQTIYRWWESKAALFVDVYDQLVVVTPGDAGMLSAPGQIRAILDQVFALYAATPAATILAGLIADAQHDRAARHALLHGLIGGRGPVLAAPLARARAQGRLPADFDVDWAVEMVVALIWKRVLSDGALDQAFIDRILASVFAEVGP